MEEIEKRVAQLSRDLVNLEVLPCGCWYNARTEEVMIICSRHLLKEATREEYKFIYNRLQRDKLK